MIEPLIDVAGKHHNHGPATADIDNPVGAVQKAHCSPGVLLGGGDLTSEGPG